MTNRRRALSLALLLLFAASGLLAETLNRVVLRVNDQIATLYDYQQRRQEAVREISNRVQDPAERRRLLGQAPEIVFRDMYEQLLLESRADQLAIAVTDREVDETISQMRTDYGIQTDEQFARALEQAGLSLPLLREQVRGNLRLQSVRAREIRPRVQVDEEDLRRYYRKNQEQFRQAEQIQVREVVIRDGSDGNGGNAGEGIAPPDERRRIAEEIRREVAAGKPLADAAAPYAQKGAATNVVDFGWVTRGDLDATLESAAWDLQAGAVSAPVEGRGGLHVLQVTERRPSRISEFSEVAEQIREREQNRVYREEVTKYMEELEKKSLIVANPPQEAAGFRRLLGSAAETDSMGNEVAPMSVEVPGAAAQSETGVGETLRPQERDTGQGQPQAPGTLPEPKPVTDAPPASPPPPGA